MTWDLHYWREGRGKASQKGGRRQSEYFSGFCVAAAFYNIYSITGRVGLKEEGRGSPLLFI